MNELSDSEFFTLPLGRIVAVGVGHSGECILKHMIEEQNSQIKLIIVNTNEQKDYEKFSKELNGADIVFILANLEEQEGIATAFNIAKTAKEVGVFTIGIVSKPFYFKGYNRFVLSDESLEALKSKCDSVVVISNDDVPNINTNAPLSECFKTIDTIFSRVISAISGVLLPSGKNDITLDIDDLKSIMYHQGTATVGIGEHYGENAAIDAVNQAMRFAMLDAMFLKNAFGVLVHFNMHPEFELMELANAMEMIHKSTNEEAYVIFGTTVDESLMLDFIRVTIIAVEKKSILSVNNIVLC